MLFYYRRHALPTIVALALLLGPASISAQPSQSSRGGTDTSTGSAVESPQAATPASTDASTNCLSVAETLDGISGLNFATIYAVALEEQGFRRFVESISPVTVLVPTDEAFRNLAELYPELSLVDILDDDYFIQRVLQFHIIPEIAEREELQVLGSRFPTLDGRSTVSVVGAEEDENEDGSDTNGDNNGATRLRGAVGSHANLLGDIYLRNICPEIRMHFIDNVLLPPQGDVDQWQQRRRSILPPSTVQDMSPPAAAQNNQQEQNNNGGVREPSFTIEAPPGGDRAQSGRQGNGGANRNGDNSAARSEEAEDEIEEVSSSLPFGISSAVVPSPGTSSPPPAPAPVGFPLFGGGGGAGFGGAGFPAFLGGGGGSPPAGGAPGGGMFGGGGPAGGLFGGPGGAFGGAGGFGGGAPGFGGAGGTGFGGGPFFGAGGGRRRLRGSV